MTLEKEPGAIRCKSKYSSDKVLRLVKMEQYRRNSLEERKDQNKNIIHLLVLFGNFLFGFSLVAFFPLEVYRCLEEPVLKGNNLHNMGYKTLQVTHSYRKKTPSLLPQNSCSYFLNIDSFLLVPVQKTWTDSNQLGLPKLFSPVKCNINPGQKTGKKEKSETSTRKAK